MKAKDFADGSVNFAGRCFSCLRQIPCKCAEYPGMVVDDDALIDFAVTCSRKELRFSAEIILRQRYPVSRKLAGAGRSTKETRDGRDGKNWT